MRHRVLPFLIVLVALLAGAAPTAGARPRADPETPVGGPLLDQGGVVMHPGNDVPTVPKVTAKSYVVADADTGKVLAAKDPHGRYRPASTLKVLTAITLIPELEKDEKVRPKRPALAVEGSKVGVTAKMRYRVEDLFLGLLLASGNDAALALARAAGGLDHTLALMNAKADELHAYDTVAKTPNGLDRPGQRSSAYDLALLARAGLDMPAFRTYVGTERATFPAPKGKGFRIANHNDLLYEYNGCIGVKTGYTTKAKATYIGAAQRDSHTLIVTLMHAKPAAWEEDAADLLDWGFSAGGEVTPVGELVEPGALATPTPFGSAADVAPPPDTDPLERDAAAPIGPERESQLVLAVSGGLIALIAACFGWLALTLLRRRRPGRYHGRRRL